MTTIACVGGMMLRYTQATKLKQSIILTLTPGLHNRNIVGKWKLVSFTREEVATGKKIKFLGEHPKGFIVYTSRGRMMAVLARRIGSHPTRKDEFQSDDFEHVIAYSGLYRLDGNKVIHDVDVSWAESLVRTTLTRFVKLENDTLTLYTALDENSAPGKDVTDMLVFQKEN